MFLSPAPNLASSWNLPVNYSSVRKKITPGNSGQKKKSGVHMGNSECSEMTIEFWPALLKKNKVFFTLGSVNSYHNSKSLAVFFLRSRNNFIKKMKWFLVESVSFDLLSCPKENGIFKGAVGKKKGATKSILVGWRGMETTFLNSIFTFPVYVYWNEPFEMYLCT